MKEYEYIHCLVDNGPDLDKRVRAKRREKEREGWTFLHTAESVDLAATIVTFRRRFYQGHPT